MFVFFLSLIIIYVLFSLTENLGYRPKNKENKLYLRSPIHYGLPYEYPGPDKNTYKTTFDYIFARDVIEENFDYIHKLQKEKGSYIAMQFVKEKVQEKINNGYRITNQYKYL